MQTATLTAKAAVSGSRSFKVTRGSEPRTVTKLSIWDQIVRFALPTTGNRDIDAYRVRNALNVMRGLGRVAVARVVKAPTFIGVVSAKVFRADGSVLDLGVVSARVVTDVGVGFIVDAFQNLKEAENMKYHGFGTGTTPEAAGDAALVTELTTQYATDNTRPTGSLTEGASSNIFRTVGTLSPDASVAITEHGVFDQAANSGGVLLDRSKFSPINLVSGDSLQITYDLILTSGS